VSVATRTWKQSFICQSDDQGGHQRLVRGGVQDGPEHGTHVEAPSDPAVELQSSRTPCQIPSAGKIMSVSCFVGVLTQSLNPHATSRPVA
jgi:hypothetical protein